MFEQEKMEWLKSIRAVKLPEPVIYIYTIPGHDGYYLLSEREIREKTVEGLQKQYEKGISGVAEAEKREALRKTVAREEIHARLQALENIMFALLSGHITPEERGAEWDAWAELFSKE